MEPTFKTRTEYLAWRTEWRAKYRKTSEAIRKNRLEIKEAFRSGDTHRASRLQGQTWMLSGVASRMMEQRMELKAKHAAYRAAQKAEVAA
jgi:hypothetical protein